VLRSLIRIEGWFDTNYQDNYTAPTPVKVGASWLDGRYLSYQADRNAGVSKVQVVMLLVWLQSGGNVGSSPTGDDALDRMSP
jgi:hypothetical protein